MKNKILSYLITACMIFSIASMPVAAEVASVKLDKEALTLEVGEKGTLTPEVMASGDQSVSWTSDKEDVVTVEGGVITAVAGGEATITATSVQDSKKSASCKVTVIVPIPATEISLDDVSIEKGGDKLLTAKITPENATDKAVTWSSSDDSIATVDENGKITTLEKGVVTITAKSKKYPEISGTCTVTVTAVTVKEITLENTSVVKGYTENLKATVLPENAEDTTIDWTSLNTDIATIDENGKITGVKAGEATIAAKSKSNTKVTATCKVTVTEPIAVTKVTLDKAEVSIGADAKYTLSATVEPENATDKTVTWTSDKEDVATVEGGIITAVAEGTAKITAKVGDKTAECTVTVTAAVPAEKVELDKTDLTLVEGEKSAALIATITPDNVTNKTVVWTSDKEDVATAEDGVITAVSYGTAKITAKAGDKTAECIVTVLKKNPTKFEDTEVIFDGKEHKIGLTDTPEGATVKFVFAGTEISEQPQYKDVGEYTLKVKVTAEGYAPFEGSATLKIVEPKFEDKLFIYDSEGKSVAAEAPEGATVSYKYKAGEEEKTVTEAPSFTEVGVYPITAKIEIAGKTFTKEATVTIVHGLTVKSIDPSKAEVVFNENIAEGTEVNLDFSALRYEPKEAEKSEKTFITVTNFVLVGKDAENYKVTTEEFGIEVTTKETAEGTNATVFETADTLIVKGLEVTASESGEKKAAFETEKNSATFEPDGIKELDELAIGIGGGKIVFNKTALAEIATGQTEDIKFSIEKDASSLTEAQNTKKVSFTTPVVYSLKITGGGNDFGTGTATVTLPYAKPASGTVVAVYFKDDGTTEAVTHSYDEANQIITLTLSHFSDYLIYTQPASSGGHHSGGSSSGSGSSSGGSSSTGKQTSGGQASGGSKNQIVLTIGKANASIWGEEKTNDVAPIIRNDRTMLPIRFIAEALGATVDWDGENKIVTITSKDTVIIITIGNSTAIVNGSTIALDSPAFIESDRTFLPLRFVSENLGAKVDWVEETKQVIISK